MVMGLLRTLRRIILKHVMVDVNLISDKYVYTAIICLAQLSYGLSCSSFGPSFVDLKHIFNTSMNEISLVTTFMSFGYMVGSLCGLLVQKMNKRVAMISSLVLMCVMIVLIPYSRQVLHLYLCFWLFGFGSGVYVNVKYVWLIDMWNTNSAPVLHLAGFMFGIGHTIGPLVEKPYLTGENHDNTKQLSAMLMIRDQELRRHKLMNPYLFCGAIQLIAPILMTMFYCTRTRDPTKNALNRTNSSGDSGESTPSKQPKPFDRMHSKKLILIILVSVLLSFFSASESAFFAFSATYFQYIPLKLSASRAAELVSLMALTFTVSRGLAVLIAIRLKPHYIIAIFLSILLISLIILFFSTNSLTLLWLGIMTMSFGFSPIYASIFSLMGRYVEFTSRIGTILMLSANSLNLVLPYVLGKYIEHNPNVFLLSLIFCIILSTVFFAFIIYFVVKSKKLMQNIVTQKHNGFTILEQ